MPQKRGEIPQKERCGKKIVRNALAMITKKFFTLGFTPLT